MFVVTMTMAAVEMSSVSGDSWVAYEFQALHSGKLLDVRQGSKDPGVPIIQWSQNGGRNQDWDMKRFSTVGDFDLVIIQSWDSGKVLDVAETSMANGAAVVQNEWSASPSQLWIVFPFGDTAFNLIINVNSGKVADVAGAQVQDGAPVIQWSWHGGANQLWDIPQRLP